VAVIRVSGDGRRLILLSADSADEPGREWELAGFPATAHLLARGVAGQVIAGDAASDPAELRELERCRQGAALMVPIVIGAAGRGLLEVYRRRPQAFSHAEVDRAHVVALQFGAVLGRLNGG
jgi:hypothetical protein